MFLSDLRAHLWRRPLPLASVSPVIIAVSALLVGCGGGPASHFDMTWTTDGETQSVSMSVDEGLYGDVGMLSRLDFGEPSNSPHIDLDALIPRAFGRGLVMSFGASRPDNTEAYARADLREIDIEVTEIAFDGRAPLTLRGSLATTERASFEATGTFETMPRCWDPDPSFQRGSVNIWGCGTNISTGPRPENVTWFPQGVFPSQIGSSAFQTASPPLCDDAILDPIVGDLSLEHDLPRRLTVGGRELDCRALKAAGLDYAFCHDEEVVEVQDCTFDVRVFNDDRFLMVTARAAEECSLPRNCIAMYDYDTPPS